jgi:FAD/FMN-containing dehydrogenase
MSAALLSKPVSVQELPDQLPLLEWITEEDRVKRLSHDFSWFSPTLKRELAEKKAELVARPRNLEEIRQVVAACATALIPLTVRGAGTNSKGQSTPIHGGVVLDISGFNGFCWIRGHAARAQAGIRLSEFNQIARQKGLELSCTPAAFGEGTLGGILAGGVDGARTLQSPPLSTLGSLLGVRIMTVEAEPQIIELRGADAQQIYAMCGTNGIVLEVEMALSAATQWTECVAQFDSFEKALTFANKLTHSKDLIQKEVALLAAPIPSYIPKLTPLLSEQHCAVVMLIDPACFQKLDNLVATQGGQLCYKKTMAEVQESQRSISNYTWHRTTFHALKLYKNLTYIQSEFTPSQHIEQVRILEKELGGEVLMHLEFFRTPEGDINCSGLQLVHYTHESRLNQIMDIYRSQGVRIKNPHVYIVEDEKPDNLAPKFVKMKERFDPLGLLNPGKLPSWASREGRS